MFSDNKKLLPEKIADEIKRMIIEKKLKPHDKLPNEIELSKQLNVSRTVIREAIKILVSTNVLEIKRGKGTFVTDSPGISTDPLGLIFVKDKKKILLDLFEIRLIIEPEIAALSAERASEEQIKKMQLICEEIERDILEGLDHSKKDRELHAIIAKSSKNSVVSRLIPIINNSIDEGVIATRYNENINNKVIKMHKKIVEAISQHEVENARNFMRQHIVDAINEINFIYK